MAKFFKTKVSLKSNLAPKSLLWWLSASINSLVWLVKSKIQFQRPILNKIQLKKNMSLRTVEMVMGVFYALVVSAVRRTLGKLLILNFVTNVPHQARQGPLQSTWVSVFSQSCLSLRWQSYSCERSIMSQVDRMACPHFESLSTCVKYWEYWALCQDLSWQSTSHKRSSNWSKYLTGNSQSYLLSHGSRTTLALVEVQAIKKTLTTWKYW